MKHVRPPFCLFLLNQSLPKSMPTTAISSILLTKESLAGLPNDHDGHFAHHRSFERLTDSSTSGHHQGAPTVLAEDFNRFQDRMDSVAKHISDANNKVGQVKISAQKISKRFAQIEKAEIPQEPSLPNHLLMPHAEPAE